MPFRGNDPVRHDDVAAAFRREMLRDVVGEKHLGLLRGDAKLGVRGSRRLSES